MSRGDPRVPGPVLGGSGAPGLAEAVLAARRLVDEADAVTVLTGAGISTDSGIPDFRGPNGLWTRDPDAEKAATLSAWTSDPELRRRAWRRRAAGELWPHVEPNPGHRALLALEEREKLLLVVTQNVDGLHQAAGTDPSRVVEVHGTTRRVRCLSCSWSAPTEVVLERVRAGDDDPHCEICGGLLKSATVSFGQNLDPRDLARAEAAASACDLFLAVGTSLQVFPINETVPLAAAHGARIVIVNGEPTPYDALADVVVRGSISEVLPVITGAADPGSGGVGERGDE
ncbi:MAG: NAD-dependent deacetylase [Actinomyces sp.]|nr:MAG: NAD-dependent deacetylase [Actinomyces sp.]